MQPQWDFYLLTLNENREPASIALDFALTDSAPDRRRPRLLCVRVPYLGGVQEKPAPPVEESAALDQISKDLESALKMASGALHVGRLSTNSFREFFYYARTSDALERVVDGIARRHEPYKILYQDKSDPEWKYFLEFLCPTEISLQWMKNRDTVGALGEAGDNLSTSRLISHWLYFPTEIARQAFLVEAGESGFAVKERFPSQKGKDRFGVEITRTDVAELDHIHGVAVDLMKAADRQGGDYDGWESPVVKLKAE